jgi:hypothetical protein
MKNLFIKIVLTLCMAGPIPATAFVEPIARVMVMDFQLHDLTDLPNAPEELARIAFLSSRYKEMLAENGVELIPVNEQIKSVVSSQSPTYLFDRVEQAAQLAEGSGADYLLIGVALKPTYLFVYPRILLVDIKSRKVVMARASQLESSWSDQNTTARTAEKLATMVSEELKKLVGQPTMAQ